MLRNPVYAFCVFLLCTGFVICEEASRQIKSDSGSSQRKDEILSAAGSSPISNKITIPQPTTPSKETTTLSSPEPTADPSKHSTSEAHITHSSPPPLITNATTHSPPTSPPLPPSSTSHSNPQPPITSTTAHSPTSPPLPPSSTPIPVTPSPPPEMGKWNITEGNQTCIIIEGQFQIHVKFEDKKLNKTEDIVANVPKFAQAIGNCGEGKIILSWAINNTLEFDFMKNGTEKNYFIHGIHIDLETASKLGPIPPINKAHLHEYPTPLNQSYSCGATREIKLDDKGSKLVLEQFHLQAFKLSNGHGFDESLSCIGGSTPDIVPIIVGCVLALLVISVLVAYLISRRRSQTRGYLSM